MRFPEFFDQVTTLSVRDPLAALLGAAEQGVLTYGYADAVKLAGHSCPTVAGAYLMTCKALGHLYPDSLPERGGVTVEFNAAQADGVTGVIAAVAGLLTGAAGEGGFKGLNGRFSRQNLLRFGVAGVTGLRFTRSDSGAGVAVSYHPEVVPAAPELQTLMAKLLTGEASEAEKIEFGRLWQLRVKRILIDHFDDPALVKLSPVA